MATRERTRGVAVVDGRFGALIRRGGWTQTVAASLVGVTDRQIRAYEAGERVPLAVMKVLCTEAGVAIVAVGDGPVDWREPG
jgi:hypothetical protein